MTDVVYWIFNSVWICRVQGKSCDFNTWIIIYHSGKLVRDGTLVVENEAAKFLCTAFCHMWTREKHFPSLEVGWKAFPSSQPNVFCFTIRWHWFPFIVIVVKWVHVKVLYGNKEIILVNKRFWQVSRNLRRISNLSIQSREKVLGENLFRQKLHSQLR